MNIEKIKVRVTQSGQTMNKASMGDMMRKMMAADNMSVHHNRCIYENDDILVEQIYQPV